MAATMDWQGVTGQSWADEWRRTDRSFTALTEVLLARIGAEAGSRILDIGCGAGELSLALAKARPGAAVVGLDISAQLVDAATARADGAARFALGDAASWAAHGFAPDLLVSRHGVMFFDDPPAAFAHLSALAAHGARLVFSCFRAPALNGWASEIGTLVANPGAPLPDPFAPGPFAFADPERVRAVLGQGWTDIAFEPVDFTYVAGEGADPIADAEAFFARIGPFAMAMRSLSEGDRPALAARLRKVLERNRSGDRIEFPAAAWIVTATSRV
jgi:SAM-dependent methyltransferase